jgi:hypothetical protein
MSGWDSNCFNAQHASANYAEHSCVHCITQGLAHGSLLAWLLQRQLALHQCWQMLVRCAVRHQKEQQ